MNSHLSKARSCTWYEKGKLRELGLDNLDNLSVPALHEPEDSDDLENYDPQQDLDLDMDFGPYKREFNFIPSDEPEIGHAGPGPQTVENQILQGAANTHPILDDDDNQ